MIWKKLRDVASVRLGLTTRAQRTGPACYGVLNLRNIDEQGQLVVRDALDRLQLPDTKKAHARAKRRSVEVGDLLVKARGTQYQVARYDEVARTIAESELGGAPVIAHSNLAIVRPHPSQPPLISWLLLGLLRHHTTETLVRRRSAAGSKTLALRTKDLEALELTWPEEQTRAHLGELMRASEAFYRAAIAAAEQRRELAMQVIWDRLEARRDGR